MKSWLVVACLAAVLLTSPVSAQVTETEATFWMHASNVGVCCQYWTNVAKDDADHTVTSVSFLGGWPAPNPVDNPGVDGWPSGYGRSTFVEAPVRESLALEEGGNAEMVVHIGNGIADGRTGHGYFEVLQGEQVVAISESVEFTYGTAFAEYRWTAPLNVTEISGDALTWRMYLIGQGRITVGMNDDDGWTHLILPLAVPKESPPGPVYLDLTGDAASIARAFSESTTRTYIYNWTAPDAEIDLTYDFSGAGGMDVSVVDANGKEVLRKTAASDGQETLTASPGQWQVTLNVTDFTGELDVSLKPVSGEAPPTSEAPPASTSPAPSSQPTSSTPPPSESNVPVPTEESNDSPAGIWLAMLALFGVALVRRKL